MDIDLSLLGPYAEVFKNGEGFKSDKANSKPIHLPTRNFKAMHKKGNVMFAEDTESRRASISKEKESSRKADRALKFMIAREARHPNVKTSNTVYDKTDKPTRNRKYEKGPENDPNNNHDKAAAPQVKATAGVNLKHVPVKPTDSAQDKSARREQLKKWRRERDAIVEQSKKTQTKPSTSGGAIRTKNIDNSDNSATSAKNTLKTAAGGSRIANDVKKKNQTDSKVSRTDPSKEQGTASVPVEVKESKKRVTRAMTKALAGEEKTKLSSKTKSKKAVSGHKDEDISAVTSQQGISQSSKKPQASIKTDRMVDKEVRPEKRDATKGSKPSTKSAVVSEKKQQIKSKDSLDDPVQSTSAEKSGVGESAGSRKLKPHAIDDTYIKFNKKFAEACEILDAYSTKWIEIREQHIKAMNEDVQGEIRSALGNVNLLLKSKLPQFITLLYKYVCQEDFGPGSILPCDLEGWWEVASIQVEGTVNKFKELEKLRRNKWRKFSPTTPPTATPSRGGSPVTPLVRQLSRNLSIGDGSDVPTRMLKVRETMGSMTKIGAVPISAEKDQRENLKILMDGE